MRIDRHLVALVLCVVCAAAAGQKISHPIRIVVPSPPAGPTDFTARIIAPSLSEAIGQNVIIDNRPSVNGVVAAELVSKAAPDGFTLMMGNSGTHAINAALYRKLPYDPQRDFAPIRRISSSGFVLLANSRTLVRSWSDLAVMANKSATRLNLGIAGATAQLAAEALKLQGKIALTNVPYKGSSPTELAIVSGEVQVALLTPIASVSHVTAGKLRALGVTSTRRIALLPEVPTLSESGLEGYAFELWNGLFAPARTPEAVLQNWRRELERVLALPQVKERFVTQGFAIDSLATSDFANALSYEIQKYRRLVADAGIPLD